MMITINEAPLTRPLIIRSFDSERIQEISDIESRLMHLGFIHGAQIVLKQKAPLFQQPYLVEVRGRLVALSLSEAVLVQVEVLI
jgi:Fe2+ transport system protein FeoA